MTATEKTIDRALRPHAAGGGARGIHARLVRLARGRRLARRTVRLRLTLLYGGLFALSGALLLTIVYLLVQRATTPVVYYNGHLTHKPATVTFPAPPPDLPSPQRTYVAQHSATMHELLVQSGIALAWMTAASLALGWLIAGRALAPLRTMTAATQLISERNLHERLSLTGPRDELTDLADTIDALLARLEAAFDAQRRFVANASHELRTPLAMMRTSLDVAAGKPGPAPPALTALDGKLREGLDQADRLLESFLTLARAEHGELADSAPVSLDAVAVAALAARAAELTGRGGGVRSALAAAPVQGNATLLARMTANLIDNAIRHAPPSAPLRVETAVAGGRARLTVHSGGRALDPDAVAALAQPFQRLGAARTGARGGVGLGLSIVAAIAAAHRGSLTLRAHPEGGLEAVVELPGGSRA